MKVSTGYLDVKNKGYRADAKVAVFRTSNTVIKAAYAMVEDYNHLRIDDARKDLDKAIEFLNGMDIEVFNQCTHTQPDGEVLIEINL